MLSISPDRPESMKIPEAPEMLGYVELFMNYKILPFDGGWFDQPDIFMKEFVLCLNTKKSFDTIMEQARKELEMARKGNLPNGYNPTS